ncbi:MAG: M28 family peptidase [Lachnospiraceae bacterium]|nr:M28 family peptidase [Lachnospiraceae bacterium]
MRRRICFLAMAMVILLSTVYVGVNTVRADDYGTTAYTYMDYISKTYPGRWWDSENNELCYKWLCEEITRIGYSYTSVHFDIEKEGNPYFGENIVFEQKGQSDKVIVVAAHYDCVSHTSGVDDNASGVGLVLEEAIRILGNTSIPYTVRFILFDAEEEVCLGSLAYVRDLSEAERNNIVAMVNVDTICGGDNMYLYGGGLDGNFKVVRAWFVNQAMDAADKLGLDMKTHPDVNETFPTPTKYTGSDQQPFDAVLIPYLYFEASNWNGGNYNNFYQTDNPAVENGKMMHVEQYENMDFYLNTFGSRVTDHLTAYSKLLDYMLKNIVLDSDVCALTLYPETEPATEPPTTEEPTEEPTTEAPTEEPTTEEITTEAVTEEVTTEEVTEEVTETAQAQTEASAEESGEAKTSASEDKETQETVTGRVILDDEPQEKSADSAFAVIVVLTIVALLGLIAFTYYKK